MFRCTPQQNYWKSHSHLHWSNPLRRWVYVKFSAFFITGLIATPFISYFWTGAMNKETKHPPETFANVTMQIFMEMAPLNLMSRTIGDIASSEIIPQYLHQKAIRVIGKIYGINLEDFDATLESYRTAQDFFCRTFGDFQKQRPIDQSALELVSPCDAEILQCGELLDDRLNSSGKKMMLQVKGHSYPVEGLFRMTLPTNMDNPHDQLNLGVTSASSTKSSKAETETEVVAVDSKVTTGGNNVDDDKSPRHQSQSSADINSTLRSLASNTKTNNNNNNSSNNSAITKEQDNNHQKDQMMKTKSSTENENTRVYFVFHLRPGDYHRVHSPRDQRITKTLYVPGLLYPTTQTAMRWLPNIILSNERILSFGYTYDNDSKEEEGRKKLEMATAKNYDEINKGKQKKLTAMALVGATCVGKIVTSFDRRIVTNLPEPPETTVLRNYKNAAPLIKKGDEVGYFLWGSCVVLVADVSKESLAKNGGKLNVKPGDNVKVGQRLI